eukprot:492118-Pyramimonas_sp.AAC.1
MSMGVPWFAGSRCDAGAPSGMAGLHEGTTCADCYQCLFADMLQWSTARAIPSMGVQQRGNNL